MTLRCKTLPDLRYFQYWQVTVHNVVQLQWRLNGMQIADNGKNRRAFPDSPGSKLPLPLPQIRDRLGQQEYRTCQYHMPREENASNPFLRKKWSLGTAPIWIAISDRKMGHSNRPNSSRFLRPGRGVIFSTLSFQYWYSIASITWLVRSEKGPPKMSLKEPRPVYCSCFRAAGRYLFTWGSGNNPIGRESGWDEELDRFPHDIKRSTRTLLDTVTSSHMELLVQVAIIFMHTMISIEKLEKKTLIIRWVNRGAYYPIYYTHSSCEYFAPCT